MAYGDGCIKLVMLFTQDEDCCHAACKCCSYGICMHGQQSGNASSITQVEVAVIRRACVAHQYNFQLPPWISKRSMSLYSQYAKIWHIDNVDTAKEYK